MAEENTAGNFLFDLLTERNTVRSFDPDRSIPEKHVRKIVEAAQKSPSSFNLQSYAFISVKDMEKRREIAGLAGRQWFICDASLFFVICTDLHKMDIVTETAGYEYYQKRFLESFLMAAVDAALAGQTAALAAESLGYGICMIGGVRNHIDRVADILELPDMVSPVFGLCVGHPVHRNPSKPRLPLEGVLFEDRYDRDAVKRAIEVYDSTMAESGIYDGREYTVQDVKRTGARPPDIPSVYGWIEHSARRVCTRNPEKARQELRVLLEKRGFGLG